MKLELKKILCPVDFSRNAAYATRYAIAFAEVHGSEVLILGVKELAVPMAYVGVDGIVPIDMLEGVDAQVRRKDEPGEPDDLNRLVEDLRESHGDVKITLLRAIGKPFVEIIRTAREHDVDLIVMGTHGRTGLAHMLIGSTAEKVVRMAPCPVMTIKHPEHEFVMP